MSRALPRIFSAVVGLAVSFAIAYLTLTVGNSVVGHNMIMATGGLFQTSGYDQTAHSFYAVHTLALIVASGFTAFIIAWKDRPIPEQNSRAASVPTDLKEHVGVIGLSNLTVCVQ